MRIRARNLSTRQAKPMSRGTTTSPSLPSRRSLAHFHPNLMSRARSPRTVQVGPTCGGPCASPRRQSYVSGGTKIPVANRTRSRRGDLRSARAAFTAAARSCAVRAFGARESVCVFVDARLVRVEAAWDSLARSPYRAFDREPGDPRANSQHSPAAAVSEMFGDRCRPCRVRSMLVAAHGRRSRRSPESKNIPRERPALAGVCRCTTQASRMSRRAAGSCHLRASEAGFDQHSPPVRRRCWTPRSWCRSRAPPPVFA